MVCFVLHLSVVFTTSTRLQCLDDRVPFEWSDPSSPHRYRHFLVRGLSPFCASAALRRVLCL
eukprot:m.87092 g.87092  ORF g.87092 m.87092 type:complete len:62 (-) comp9686_c0_seq1:692-877(-)